MVTNNIMWFFLLITLVLFAFWCTISLPSCLQYPPSICTQLPNHRHFNVYHILYIHTQHTYTTGIPGLTNPTVLGALFSLTATGLYSSYLIPILLRVTVGRSTFQPAEMNLGKYSLPMGIFSVVWCLFMILILCLPQAAPISVDNMNYSPIALGIVIIFAYVSWMVSARHWFKGSLIS